MFALSKTSILVPDLLLFRFLLNLKGIHFMSTRSEIPQYNQALLTSTLVTKTKPKIALPFAGALFNEKNLGYHIRAYLCFTLLIKRAC